MGFYSALNILWLPNILIFHAVISTTVTILVLRSLWPGRVSKSFLGKKHYIALGAVLTVAIIITNVVLVPLVARSMGYSPPFEPLPFFLLLLLSLSVVLLIKKSLTQRSLFRVGRVGFPTVVYVLVGAAIFILPIVASHIALAFVGAWLAGALIIILWISLYKYFSTLDFDAEPTKRKTFFVYSTFIVIVLLIEFGGRQPASNLVAVAGVALELFFWVAGDNCSCPKRLKNFCRTVT